MVNILEHIDASIFLTFGALSMAIVSLWHHRSSGMWILFAILALGFGYYYGYVRISAFIPIVFLILSCYVVEKWPNEEHVSGRLTFANKFGARPLIQFVAALIIIVLSVLLATHSLPGFFNPPAIREIVLSEGAPPYSQNLNFDKALVGLLLLAFFPNLIKTGRQWKTTLITIAPYAAFTIFIVAALSVASGYVRFDPKWTSIFYLWAFINLAFTCVAEEAFFRGFLQRHLANWLTPYRYGAYIACVVGAVCFGIAHFAGGIEYVILSTFAGFGYGWVFMKTNRVESAILTHFSLNATHFTLLTYPRLA